MPDALPLTGLFGKVPAHGDFVRRGLPTSFVGPWDTWLQDGMATAREALGDRWASRWDSAPPWRFALPAGACGPDAVAGVMLPSEDMVGRRFPITLAVLLPPGAPVPGAAWFTALEAAALAGRAGQADADALAAAIPLPGQEPPEPMVPATWIPAAPDDPLSFAMAPEHAAVPPTEDVLDLPGGLPPGPASLDAPDDPLAMFGAGGTPLGAPLSGPVHDMLEEPVPAETIGTPAVGAPATTGSVMDIIGGGIGPDPREAVSPEAAPIGDIFGIGGADEAAPVADVLASPGDVLDFFSRPPSVAEAPEPPIPMHAGAAAPHMATPDGHDSAASDGTLAFLLGEGGAAPALEPDPLTALLGARDTPPLAAASIAPSAPIQATPIPMALDEPPTPAAAREEPVPPDHGGWSTGGGGGLPPGVWALPALIPARAFASLLEADA
jgi:type VI secretion system protein ImpM